MKKASWLSFVLVLSALSSFGSYAQRNNRPDGEELIEARVQQHLGAGQRLNLSQFLHSRERNAEVISLTITGQSFQGPAEIHLSAVRGILETLTLRKQLKEVSTVGMNLGDLDLLHLSASESVYIEKITAQIRGQRPIPQPRHEVQVAAHSLITVQVNQQVTNGELALKRLVKEQLGLTLEGAQIERVIVEGMAIGRAAPAFHVELNNRIASQVKYLNARRNRTPLPVTSNEEVKNLRLVVIGPALIHEVNIRIGRVRPVYAPAPIPVPLPASTRLYVAREVHPSYPLDLGMISHEQRLVRSMTLETNVRGYASGELTIMNRQGRVVGRGFLAQGRTMVYLSLPTALSDIRIHSPLPVYIGTAEIQH